MKANETHKFSNLFDKLLYMSLLFCHVFFVCESYAV